MRSWFSGLGGSHGWVVGSLAWALVLGCASAASALEIQIDFDAGVDSFGAASGELVFAGPAGLTVTFTDDGSGDAGGVRITDEDPGNVQDGSGDLVLGSLNAPSAAFTAFHVSGIVASFSRGVEAVSFSDTDDDATPKTLFAFDAGGALIGQTAPGAQIPFSIDTSQTGGKLIHRIEFDNGVGTAGGANNGTAFTIDDFQATYSVPEPSRALLLVAAGLLAGLARGRRASARI
jgi:hypothetical protein